MLRRVHSGGYAQAAMLSAGQQMASSDAGRFVTSSAQVNRWHQVMPGGLSEARAVEFYAQRQGSGGSNETLLKKVKMILLQKMLEPATSI